MTQIAVRIDAELWKTIRLESVKRDRSASSIVTEALADWLKKQTEN